MEDIREIKDFKSNVKKSIIIKKLKQNIVYDCLCTLAISASQSIGELPVALFSGNDPFYHKLHVPHIHVLICQNRFVIPHDIFKKYGFGKQSPMSWTFYNYCTRNNLIIEKYSSRAIFLFNNLYCCRKVTMKNAARRAAKKIVYF